MDVCLFSCSFAIGCREASGRIQCICKPGYTGERCERCVSCETSGDHVVNYQTVSALFFCLHCLCNVRSVTGSTDVPQVTMGNPCLMEAAAVLATVTETLDTVTAGLEVSILGLSEFLLWFVVVGTP